MATLEIHDGRNQVRRVRITRDNPAMFGSDPMCDIVLDGSGVQPFHGRIRWKSRRFKADASPEVPWIEVNGIQVKSKSLYQGDEIRVGNCRIFLLSVEDGPDHGQKTVMQDQPPNPGRSTVRPSPPSPKDYARMEMAPPSVEMADPRSVDTGNPQVPLKRARFGRKADFDDVDDALTDRPGRRRKAESLSGMMRQVGDRSAEQPATDQEPIPTRPFRFGDLFRWFERAPGDDRVFNSPLVIGLVVTFVLLVAFSFALWETISRAMASSGFNTAAGDMEAGLYPAAIKGFDAFLTSYPKDRRANKAKVLRALARVRQHTGAVGASWGNAVDEARAMVEDVGDLPEYRDSSVELAEDLLKAAEALADRSAEFADSKVLNQAEYALKLHAKVAGQAAAAMIEKSRVPAKLASARASIRKSKDRDETLAAMTAAIQAKHPADAYAARKGLVLRYADLARDKEIARRIAQANDLIRQAVAFEEPSGTPAETAPKAEIAGPPTSLVLRLDPGKPPGSGRAAVAFAIADGLAFGLDAATGAPLWQALVGQGCPFPPMAIPGDPPTVLLFDARTNELTRRDARSGRLIWRREIGEPVADPPLILGNQLFQPTEAGALVQLDLATGALRGTLAVGRPARRTPVADDSASRLFLVADEDCLFVLAVDPLRCVAVEYLGHESGTIAVAPVRAGRYYIVPQNDAIDAGRLRVFVIDEAGEALKPVQELPVGGWVASPPANAGSVLWSASDRGELMIYAVGGYDSPTPFTKIAGFPAGTSLEGPAFVRPRNERDFTLASSRSGRFEIDQERQTLTTLWTRHEAGPALAAPQAFDRAVVLTQQDEEGPGVAIWGLDPNSGDVRWRTTLGAPWPVALAASTGGDRLATLAGDGREVFVGLESLRDGGFVELPIIRPGMFRLPASTTQRIEIDGVTVVVPEAAAARVLVRAAGGDFRPVELPAPLAATVLVLGKDLVIPGLDGRIYLIDPRTGASSADPYVPPFDRSRPIRWRTPVPVDGGGFVLADSEATLRRLSVDRSGRPRLVVTAELKLDKPLASDPGSTGSTILAATQDGKVRSLASRDLGPQGVWALEAPRLLGPVIVADHGFVADAAGNVLAFAPDGRRIWSARLVGTIAAGPPAILDQSVWFLGRDGSIQRFALSDGTPQSASKLDILPAGGPVAIGPALALPTGLGSVRLLDPKSQRPSGANGP